MWQYRKVSSETCSRISLEITPEVACTTAHNAKGTTSEKVLKISHSAHAARVNVSQETRMAKALAHDQKMMKINSVILLLSKLCNFRLLGVPNNPCGLTGMLNINDGATLIDNSLKILQKQSVLQIKNTSFILAFLLSNARPTFLSQNVSPSFFHNARFASNRRPPL